MNLKNLASVCSLLLLMSSCMDALRLNNASQNKLKNSCTEQGITTGECAQLVADTGCRNGALNAPNCDVCSPGNELRNNMCLPITCPVGQRLLGNTCIPITCPQGQRLEGNNCVAIVCPEGQRLQGNDCVAITCGVGLQLQGNMCVPIVCPQGQVLVGNNCVSSNCANGAVNFPQCNMCPTNMMMRDNSCVARPCINGANNPPQCNVCPAGTSLSNGICVQACLNGGTNPPLCNICPAGQRLSNNVCRPIECPAGQKLMGNTCVPDICPNGATNPPACNSCPADKMLENGICVARACSNGALTPPACVDCPASKVMQNGVCVDGQCSNGAMTFPACNDCPPDKMLENGICVARACSNGALDYPGCTQCPAGQEINNGRCMAIVTPPPPPPPPTGNLEFFPVTDVASNSQIISNGVVMSARGNVSAQGDGVVIVKNENEVGTSTQVEAGDIVHLKMQSSNGEKTGSLMVGNQRIAFSVRASGGATSKWFRVMPYNGHEEMTIGFNADQGVDNDTRIYYGKSDFGSAYARYPMNASDVVTKTMDGLRSYFFVLKNLTEDSIYYFTIVNKGKASPRFTFRTFPNIVRGQNDERKMTIIMGGDSRSNSGARRVMNALATRFNPHLIAFGGDLEDSTERRGDAQDWLEDTVDFVRDDNRIIAFATVRGNHEGRGGVIEGLFNMPRLTFNRSNGSMDCNNQNNCTSLPETYAFSIGGELIRYYMLNSETSELDQARGMQADLRAYGEKHIYRFASYHKATFPVGGDKNIQPGQRDYWAPLFAGHPIDDRGNVDMERVIPNRNFRLVGESDSHTHKITRPLRFNGRGNRFVDDNMRGTFYIGEGTWGLTSFRSFTNRNGTYTLFDDQDRARIRQFKHLIVSTSNIVMRTIRGPYQGGRLSNPSSQLRDLRENVEQLSDADRFRLPRGAQVFLNREYTLPVEGRLQMRQMGASSLLASSVVASREPASSPDSEGKIVEIVASDWTSLKKLKKITKKRIHLKKKGQVVLIDFDIDSIDIAKIKKAHLKLKFKKIKKGCELNIKLFRAQDKRMVRDGRYWNPGAEDAKGPDLAELIKESLGADKRQKLTLAVELRKGKAQISQAILELELADD